jgi:hypothetical protein
VNLLAFGIAGAKVVVFAIGRRIALADALVLATIDSATARAKTRDIEARFITPPICTVRRRDVVLSIQEHTSSS